MSELRDELEPLDEIEDENEEVSEGEGGAEGHQENDEDLDGGREPGEDDELGQPDQEQAQGQNVRPSRARGRAERLSRQLAEERTQRAAERTEFQRQLAEINARLSAPSAADLQRQETEERERLALMSPHELMQYTERKIGDRVGAQLRQIQFTNQTSADRMHFESLKQSDPLARRVASRVEQLAAEQEARGQFIPRQMLTSYVVGEEVRAKAARERTRQARAGRARVAAQTTRPASGRADAGTPPRGGNGYQAVLDRLKNVTF